MTLSIGQKILLAITYVVMLVLRLADVITSAIFLQIFRRMLKISAITLSAVFVLLLIYSYKTGKLAGIADGYFNNLFVFTPVTLYPKEYPVLVNSGSVPYVTSKSYLIADVKNSKILYEHNSNQKLPPASTAKLMTALVALDIYRTDEVLEVPEQCTGLDTTKAYLPVKSHFSVKDLIYSMLIGSAGDSACVLSTEKLPYENFVNLMNRKAFLLGLANTHFSNPIGLDDDQGQNFSTVQDLFALARYVMLNPLIADAVKTREYELKSKESSYDMFISSTNKLLSEIPNTLGIKTGTTESAGEVFIYNYADTQKDLIIVVMGSTDRFSDTRTLLGWALRSYSWN